MFDRIIFRFSETVGYLLCEMAFKAHCRGPFASAYRSGCWFYGQSTGSGLRCGALVANPGYRPDGEEPLYVERRSSL